MAGSVWVSEGKLFGDVDGETTLLGGTNLENLFARKTADQTLNSTTTMTDCTDLVVPAAANAVYMVSTGILYLSNTAADIRFGWTVPAGASGHWHPGGASSGIADGQTDTSLRFGTVSWTTVNAVGASAAVDLYAQPGGILVVGATAGTIQFRFTQQASTAVDTTVKANSWLKAERVA
jgi:hypothetical protein